MISNRSLSTSGLALAAILTLVSSSCLNTNSSEQRHTLAVKAESDMTQRSEARRSTPRQLEYFEGAEAPAIPAAQAEQRPSAPSPAHVWIAGHHTRENGNWVWVGGHYAMPPRTDVVWVSGHWVDHLHGYAWIPGAWR